MDNYIYNYIYINAVANSVMLQVYLQQNYYNTIFQVKLITYSLWVNKITPPRPDEIFWVHT